MIKLVRNLSIMAAVFASSAALAENSGWTISEANGQVSISRDDKALYGAQGTQLQVGDVVRTGEGARAVLVRGDDFVVVSPQKQIRIVKAAEKGLVTQVFDSLGSMLSSIEKKASPKAKPKGQVLAAVVKGYEGEGDDNSALKAAHAKNTLTPTD